MNHHFLVCEVSILAEVHLVGSCWDHFQSDLVLCQGIDLSNRHVVADIQTKLGGKLEKIGLLLGRFVEVDHLDLQLGFRWPSTLRLQLGKSGLDLKDSPASGGLFSIAEHLFDQGGFGLGRHVDAGHTNHTKVGTGMHTEHW